LPGGCSIGSRPVDIHLKGFEALGVSIRIEHGFVELRASQLIGTPMRLSFPSVGATENIMMAACLAEGNTIIENAAREPEIDDLAYFLNCSGADISGIGTDTLHIKGVSSLKGVTDYHVIPDRIEIGTLLIAAAITQGCVTVEGVCKDHIHPLCTVLTSMGAELTYTDQSITCRVDKPLHAVDITTDPHPGFPTDMQAQMMALLSVSNGTSVIHEQIFENRFMHAHELIRMGATITLDGQHARITGGPLSGADVKMTDLRAGAAMILAGLVAEGHTKISGLHHLKRGYYNLEKQ